MFLIVFSFEYSFWLAYLVVILLNASWKMEFQTEVNWLEQKSFFRKTPDQYPRFASSEKVNDLV